MTGKTEIRRKCNGFMMKFWKRLRNEEERKEFPCRQKFCRRSLNRQHMSGCLNVKRERHRRKEESQSMVHGGDESREDREKDT